MKLHKIVLVKGQTIPALAQFPQHTKSFCVVQPFSLHFQHVQNEIKLGKPNKGSLQYYRHLPRNMKTIKPHQAHHRHKLESDFYSLQVPSSKSEISSKWDFPGYFIPQLHGKNSMENCWKSNSLLKQWPFPMDFLPRRRKKTKIITSLSTGLLMCHSLA